MKKYNLSKIMKRAWELFKKEIITFSDALKKAWKEFKAMVEKIVFTGYTVMVDEEKLANAEMTFREWKKYGKHRIYVNDPRGRSCYLEIIDGNVIPVGVDARFERIVNQFLEKYSIQ